MRLRKHIPIFRLYRSGPNVVAGGFVGDWLYRTATRASIDALRTNGRRGVEGQLDGQVAPLSRGSYRKPNYPGAVAKNES